MERAAQCWRRTVTDGLHKSLIAICTALALVAYATPGQAEETCRLAAFKAFESVTGSGPFHFETKQVTGRELQRQSGRVSPGLGSHVVVEKAQAIRSETIRISGLAWRKDRFGWADPVTSAKAFRTGAPDFPFQIRSAACKSIVDFDGRELSVYEITRTDMDGVRLALFTDPAIGLPVRLETSSASDSLKVTSFTFDETIRIEPPVVDHAERRNRSLQQFAVAVARSKPECHAAALRDIAAANAKQDYSFKVEGFLATGITAIEGSVTAPSALHYRLIGSAEHGGGNERIAIGGKVWDKAGLWTGARTDKDYLKTFLARSMPDPDMIGAVTCLGETKQNGRTVRTYFYDLYQDTGTVKSLLEHRRMTVDVSSGELTLLETLDGRGNVLRVEHRTYRDGLRIAPPNADDVQRIMQAAQH